MGPSEVHGLEQRPVLRRASCTFINTMTHTEQSAHPPHLLPAWVLIAASQPHSSPSPKFLREETAGAQREREPGQRQAAWSGARTPGTGPMVKQAPHQV